MPEVKYRLSKSRLNGFRQCPRRLWLEVHQPELKEISAATNLVLAMGHEVGALAQREYPKGIFVSPDNDLTQALAETQRCLPLRKPLFEATFRYQGLLVRADLLLPRAGHTWHMIEVKSSGSPKDYHLDDIATQVWAAQGAGIKVAKASIQHLDTSFVLRKAGDYRGIFKVADVTDDVAARLPLMEETLAQAQEVLKSPEPKVTTGDHCEAPFSCPFQAHCRKTQATPAAYPVSLLPNANGKRLARELQASGIEDIREAPAHQISGEMHQRIYLATRSAKPYLDSQGAINAVSQWPWPRYYLDFETIGFAVPIWVGTRPYEQVPFQFSCHKVRRDGAETHGTFLDLTGKDPTRACAEHLIASLGKAGAIIAYNAGFERGCIRRLADRCPDIASELAAIEARIVDLLPVVKASYYHRDMLGSFSIKSVLPTLAPALTYASLDGVQDGGMAQAAYLEAIHSACEPQRKEQLHAQLSKYCELDTRAMIEVQSRLVSGASGCP